MQDAIANSEAGFMPEGGIAVPATCTQGTDCTRCSVGYDECWRCVDILGGDEVVAMNQWAYGGLVAGCGISQTQEAPDGSRAA